MNGFFSDNQTKQKAYDRYCNAMAKSDFVQGAKLKAMIQQQALDDASSDLLANLFQQVMSKSRDYDYDQITSKLTKKAPKPVKGSKPSISDIYDMMGPEAPTPKKKSPGKVKFVLTVTDTDVTMATPSPGKSSKNILNDVAMRSPSPKKAVDQEMEELPPIIAPKSISPPPKIEKIKFEPRVTDTQLNADELEEKAPIPQTPAIQIPAQPKASPILSLKAITKYKSLLDSGRKSVRFLVQDQGFDAEAESPTYFDALLTAKPTKRALTLSQAMEKIDKMHKLDDIKATITEMVDKFDEDTKRGSKRPRDIKLR
ncbi:TPA: hypothetical protein N0F65_006651 [Lagenidium giganteum]|uniref:Uncharacterized protein n=1 Tax=Lagenidium giganteum TaxID=4803 RepID=A0AAV2Z677_9STRA|nr:TPA: hypothetical protein N0F65_006651 [Lagenidium giganteum]